MRRFHDLRAELTEVTSRAQQLTAGLGPFRSEIDSRLALITAAVTASRLNLVIIGAEGNGRSTFINAMTGLDVTPTDLQEPGTVAPVYLEWTEQSEPAFTVAVDVHGKRETRRCDGRAEFAQYMLQANNPDNQRRVLAGYVRLGHPLLRNGLRLVDMPGIEGVSMAVSQEASRFINDQAHTVILVCRDRQYAPLARVADVLSNHPLRVDACVSNWSLDFWLDTGTLAERIARQKELMSRKINDEGGSVEVTSERVYVVHLPTVAGEKTVTAPEHAVQEAALRARVWQAVQQLGVDRVLLEGTGHAEVALRAIDSHLRLRDGLLSTLLEGAEAPVIVAAVTSARQRATKEWEKYRASDVVDSAAAQSWLILRPAIEKARDTMLTKISALQQRLRSGEDSGGRLSKGHARDIHNELNRCFGDALGRLQDTQNEVLQKVADTYLGAANQAIDTVYRAVPTDHEGDSVLRYHLDADAIATIAKLGSTGVLGALGGFFALSPFTAAVVGALGADTLGWAAADFVRGGEREGAQEGLRRAAENVIAMDTRPAGELYELWRGVMRDVVSWIDSVLMRRLDAMETLVSDPQTGPDVLQAQRETIAESRQNLAQLVAQLDSIGSRARG